MRSTLTHDSIFNVALIRDNNDNTGATTYVIIQDNNTLYTFNALSDAQAVRRFWSMVLDMQAQIDHNLPDKPGPTLQT